MQKAASLTFGADPEYALTETKDGKEYVLPPIFWEREKKLKPIIKDTKHPVYFTTDFGSRIMMDGVAFELTLPPVEEAKTMYANIVATLYILKDFAMKVGANLYTKPAAFFDYESLLLKRDEKFRQCVIFGCDPDMCVYEGNVPSQTIDVATHPYRYFGGHLHISGEPAIEKFPVPFVRLLTTTVGNYVVAYSPCPEIEKIRSFHYGRPGKYRIQHYPNGNVGVEFRTPSNSWTTNPEMMEGVFNWAKIAADLLVTPEVGKKVLKEMEDDSVDAITRFDVDKAKDNLDLILQLI